MAYSGDGKLMKYSHNISTSYCHSRAKSYERMTMFPFFLSGHEWQTAPSPVSSEIYTGFRDRSAEPHKQNKNGLITYFHLMTGFWPRCITSLPGKLLSTWFSSFCLHMK